MSSTRTDLPLISCLCPTYRKPLHLRRAITCFHRQTYPNKELLIVYDGRDELTLEAVADLQHPQIRLYELPAGPRLSLGAIRNISIREARGVYFCQWDDDDWYHETRVEAQFAAVAKNHKAASMLAYWLMYDTIGQRSFLSPIGPWPGTILCRKDIIDDELCYPDVSQHEDASLMMRLIARNEVFPVIAPYLYIYSYHGNNTFGQEHFNTLYSNSQPLPPEITTLFKRIFSGEITHQEASVILLEEQYIRQFNYFHNSAALPAHRQEATAAAAGQSAAPARPSFPQVPRKNAPRVH